MSPQEPYPSPPLVKHVGPLLPPAPKGPLPTDLAAFLEGGSFVDARGRAPPPVMVVWFGSGACRPDITGALQLLGVAPSPVAPTAMTVTSTDQC